MMNKSKNLTLSSSWTKYFIELEYFACILWLAWIKDHQRTIISNVFYTTFCFTFEDWPDPAKHSNISWRKEVRSLLIIYSEKTDYKANVPLSSWRMLYKCLFSLIAWWYPEAPTESSWIWIPRWCGQHFRNWAGKYCKIYTEVHTYVDFPNVAHSFWTSCANEAQ